VFDGIVAGSAPGNAGFDAFCGKRIAEPVGIIADGEANRLYAQFGFAPTAPKSIGMALVVRRK
jgi:hypothetical protein